MISGIVAKILNRTLGSFIEDLKSDQLDISLFSGTVKLENLALKKTVLDNLPVPFRLEFGYVGKIFVDIPIRNIGSSPVKIEVTNVYALLKLKPKNTWNSEAEVTAFQNSKKESLDGFEDLQESARELRAKDPGYFTKLASKIIDNIQVNVENIYIRIEDDLSYPGHPFACGLILRRIMAVTTDQDWKIKYVANADEVYKAAGVRGLMAFFNYGEKNEEVFVEHLTGKNDLQTFVDFATAECTKGRNNRWVLLPLSIELRLVLNKEPKKNFHPQIWGSLKIGGAFDPQPATGPKGIHDHLGLNVEIEQIPIAMKFLEYIGMYSKFQTGVLVDYQKTQFTEGEQLNYKAVYRDYLHHMRSNNTKKTLSKREDLEKLEEYFSLTAIKKLRVAERMEMDFEERKEESKKKTEEMVKTLEGQKTSAYTSMKSFFGSSSAKEEQKKVKEEVEKYRESLNKEQEEKLRHEREAIDKELAELFSTTAEIDVQTAIDMPPSYERFRFAVEINEFTAAVSHGLPFNASDKMVELSIVGISVGTSISKQTQKFNFAIESIDIMDYLTKNKAFGYLLESRCYEKTGLKNCISMQFKYDAVNPSSDLSLVLTNNCNLIFCINYHSIFTLMTYLSEAVFKESIETAYYNEFAKAALSRIDQYIQLGVDFAKNAYNTAELKHFAIALRIVFAAPVILIPCDPASSDNASALVCDLGTIRVSSVVHRKDPKVDYKAIMDVTKLYDYYELKLEKIQMYIQEQSGSTQPRHKYIRDLSLQLRLYNSLEPFHPTMPVIKVGGILNRVDIVLTDYNILYVLKIMGNMQKEQAKMAKKTAELQEGVAQKLIEEHGKEEAGKIAAGIAAEQAAPEIKPEEKKSSEEVGVSPDKKIREVMVHFDDINLIIGRTVLSTDGKYKAYASYVEELKASQPNEVPFLPDLRMGINGIDLFGYMTYSGYVKAEAHVFRLYARDLQIYPYENTLKKAVVSEFEYILSNPKVESITERRVGDNYSAFKHNALFFNRVERSNFFKEDTNQIDLDFDIDLPIHRMKVGLTINDMAVTLPHHTLVPPLYLLSEIQSVMPPAPPPPQVTKLPAQPKLEARQTKTPYYFFFEGKIKGVYLILPINCENSSTKYYKMGISAEASGEVNTLITGNDPSTLKSDSNFSAVVDRFGMSAHGGENKASWAVIPPTQITLTYKESASVPEDFDNTDIELKVRPIDVMIGFGEVEMLIEYATNALEVMEKHVPKGKPKKPLEEQPAVETVEKTVQPAQTVESAEKALAEGVPPAESITNKATMKIVAVVERLRFMAINDKVKDGYPLAKLCFSDISADITQNFVKEIGTSKNINAIIGNVQCELNQPLENVASGQPSYAAFM